MALCFHVASILPVLCWSLFGCSVGKKSLLVHKEQLLLRASRTLLRAERMLKSLSSTAVATLDGTKLFAPVRRETFPRHRLHTSGQPPSKQPNAVGGNEHGGESQLCEGTSRRKAAQPAKVSRRRRVAARGPEQRGSAEPVAPDRDAFSPV